MAEHTRYHDPTRAQLFAEANRLRSLSQSFTGDQGLADRVAGMTTTWPQMAPSVAYALAQAGVDPGSDTAAQIARTSQTVQAKKNRGFFTRVGDIVTAGAGMAGEGFSELADIAAPGLRGAIRGGLTAAAAPFQEAQGVLRSVAGQIGGREGGAAAGALGGAAIGSVVPGVGTALGAGVGAGVGAIAGFLGGDKIESADPGFRSQSTLGQAVGQLIKTGEADLGSGFMPGGTAAKEQERRSVEAASIAGKGLTIGRLTAASVLEPGSRPYDIVSGLVDTAAIMKLDPTVRLGMKHSQIRAVRRTILPEKADDFLTSIPGDQLMQGLAEETNAFKIWQMSKGQLPMDTAVRISNARTAQDVASVIRPELGHTVTQKFKPIVQRRTDLPRLLTDMPHGSLDWDRPKEFITKVDDLMKLAKVLPEDRLHHADQLMRVLGSGDRGARLPAMREFQNMMSSTVHALAGGRLSKAQSTQLTKMVGKSHDDLRKYTAAEIAMDKRIPGLVINNKGQKIAAPSLVSELMDKPIPLPSVKDLRHVRQEINSIIGPIMNTPVLGKGLHGADLVGTWAMSRVWKPSVLARGALTLRVIGEEQVRMSAAGLDSFFSHPVSYISRLVADRGRVGFVDELADSVDGQAALTRARATDALTFGDEGRMLPTGNKIQIQRGEEGFHAGWLDHELGHLQADPVAQHFAKNGADATKDWLWNGAGRKWLNELRQNRPGNRTFMANKADVDLYVDGVVGKRIEEFTQNDSRLLEYVAGGRRSKGGLNDMTPSEIKARNAAQKAIKELDEAGIAPQAAVGDLVEYAHRKGGGEVADSVTNWLFANLLSKPTNTLNRSRTFEQKYWERAEDVMTALDPKAQQKVIAQAHKAKLSREQIKRLEDRIPQGSGKLTLNQADTALKAQALDDVQTLLYDLSKRGQWADAIRLVFPFAEPWKEMLQTWGKLMYERPHLARRGQTVVEGARGAGFFSIDEQTGEEMFAYPGSEFVSKMATGVPIPFKGRVAGLNLFASSPVMPGFGPLVQIPAGALVPDKPQFDWLQDTINPFGASDEEGVLDKIFFPAAWMDKARKVLADPESDRLFDNTVYDVSRYLVSSGEADISTEDGQIETTKKATQIARKIYMLRTLASFAAPSAPQLKFLSGIEDPEAAGRLMTQFELVETFRGYQEEDYDSAVNRFLGDFGEEALMFMQPKTKGGHPAEEGTLEFARENPELTEKYGETWHFFAPRGGDFSYAAYVRQINKGEKEALGGKGLNQKDLQQMANNRVAGMRYRKAREMVGDRPNEVQREWLDKVKGELLQKYPGFEPEPRDIGKGARQIRELESAVQDRKLGRTDVGQAISKYFEFRDQAIQAGKDAGYKDHTGAKKMQPVREWLRNAAHQIGEAVPEFSEVYDMVLRREMSDDPTIELNPMLPTEEP